MKRINNKRNFIAGLIGAVIGIGCIIGLLCTQFDWRILTSAFIAIAFMILQFVIAYSAKNQWISSETSDERDAYVTMRTNSMAIKIMSYIILAGIILFLILYSVLKANYLIIISLTLIAVMVILLVLLLVLSIYYEKRS